MKIVWHGKSGPKQNPEKDHQEVNPLPEAEESSSHRRYNDWMEELISRHEKQGDFANLPGKGKPLQFEDDGSFDSTFNRIVKNAGVLPEWLELQKDIHTRIKSTLERRVLKQDITTEIDQINDRIRLYNRKCPSPLLQKPTVSAETLEQALERFQS